MIDARLVAAVRWDFEVGGLSQTELRRKYRLVLGWRNIYGIIDGTVQPAVVAQRRPLAWARTSWGSKRKIMATQQQP